MPYTVPCANNSGSFKFISLCNKWVVILIMAGVLYTVATHHEFDGFLTYDRECWEAAELRCKSHLTDSRPFCSRSCLLLYGQDASWKLTSDLDWRFAMCLGSVTLKCCILHGLEARNTGSNTFYFVFFWNRPQREPLKKGTVQYTLSAVCWLVACIQWQLTLDIGL